MHRNWFALVLLLTITFLNPLQAQEIFFSRARVSLESKDISQLAALGLDTDHGEYAVGRFFVSDFSEKEISLMRDAGFEVTILIEDVVSWYANQEADKQSRNRNSACFEVDAYNYAIPENYEYGSMGGYFTYQEMLNQLDSMQAQFPHLISARQPIDTFLTYEGRPIYWVRLSDNPETDEADEPEAFYNAVHHAREPNSMSQLLFYMWYLLENYETDPEINMLVNEVEMYFVPCLNPDGYIQNELTNPNGGGLFRKNKRDNDGNGNFDPSVDGVDLNRNYGYEWGFNDIGSSPNPASQVYRGPEAFSEPETQAIAAFCNAHTFQIAQNYHTYGNLLIYPFGYSDLVAAPDTFQPLAALLNSENNFLAGTGIQTVGYNVNGNSDDWMYGDTSQKPAILSFTPEVGPGNFGFWPPQSAIMELNQSAMKLNLMSARVLLIYGEATDEAPQLINEITGTLPVRLTRYGLQEGPLTVSLQGIGQQVVNTGPAQSFQLDPFQDTLFDVNYSLASDIISGDTIRFLLVVDNGLSTHADTLVKIFGQENPIFADLADNLDNWNVFPNSQWATTTEQYVSAPSSITDSPNGNYAPSTTSLLTLSDPIDLSTAENAVLQFFARWEIEAGYDYAQVLASTNGFSYSPLCGKYTVEGTSYQDEGNPVYDGVQTSWVREEINLNDYLGSTIRLRFLLGADNFLQEDGFYFDDIRVLVWEKGVVQTKNLTANQADWLQIYPNPTTDLLHLNLNTTRVQTGCYALEISDALGNLIQELPIQENPQAVSTDQLAPGTYYFRLLNQGELLQQGKFVVIR